MKAFIEPKSAKTEAPLANVPTKVSGMDQLWAMIRRMQAQIAKNEDSLTIVRRDVYRIEHKQRDMAKETPLEDLKVRQVQNVPGNGTGFALPDPFLR